MLCALKHEEFFAPCCVFMCFERLWKISCL